MTTIYVTHDQSEAMTLGDRVAVMRKGELQQLDTPQNLYRKPVNLFVAEFIGSPAMNLVEARDLRRHGRASARTSSRSTAAPGSRRTRGATVALGIRPEDLEDAALSGRPGAGAPPRHGRPARGHGRGDLPPLLGRRPEHVATEIVQEAVEAEGGVEACPRPAGRRSSPASGASRRAREGERVEVAVDTRMLHFFDLETGDAIQEE